ncbi:MAG: 23S rRNA (adenine(2503)-C(2))-methyltransferase RlmN [Candidatus Omnitrophica bacterium CG08_land_8_20_14_0_20_41_16]|uniref:Probable dual-specificity RNA methyltransferase RlmN n=1 Tax=Candidatus Sherwoodlollariibacterium unditelluris TaxID=1974757 RepID=A0A2G9YKP4_9BACT|nr:MAG: 23S rRNA (adenine(2503)-C(2))-methyltransferase RlmN [Candidatus Omnitrophica bacterium CG23_combo_of_CG06-09_8_20_14_all_41_10]PIS34334.1 MAG: 23S rRNA (adenine(2503)-C(2))-methyltransferase RlmN [Candidatus Omnitrophica bacterium CG08_land_8_20_14_0_20_41_16]
MQDIKEFNLKELESEFLSLGIKAYHARQIFTWIYKKGVFDFSRMSDLSSKLKKLLDDKFKILDLKLIQSRKSKDGTKKFLFELADKNLIEAVIIPAQGRVTGCVSTQGGCKFSCKFCASGLLGFKRNLTCSEILGEILYLKSDIYGRNLTHIVFMGIGEPLDNYDNVLEAIRIINSKDGFNIGARRITISTCGITPAIKRLAEENLQIELSVSLHAANDKLRSNLMPVNKKYPLKELIKACKEYSLKTNRQVTFEHILIKGVNSSLKNAQDLVKLLEGFKLSKINIIPANYIKELHIEPADKTAMILFKDYLVKYGVHVTLRKERGEDIGAACGQLRLQHEKE